MVENSDLLLNASLPQISDFIFAIGLIEAKPPQWEVIKEHFTKNDININSDHLEFLVLRLALSFAVLEIYKVNLYKHIFNPTALEKFSKNRKLILLLFSFCLKKIYKVTISLFYLRFREK